MDDPNARPLENVRRCTDPKLLRNIVANARRQGNDVVEQAASRKLYSVLPLAEPGTLEFDVWQSIHALEDTLKSERGKTVMLGRTRQKIAKSGEAVTVADLVTGKPSDGFRMLMDRGMVELTFEAVALRHPDRFDEAVLTAARERLRDVGA